MNIGKIRTTTSVIELNVPGSASLRYLTLAGFTLTVCASSGAVNSALAQEATAPAVAAETGAEVKKPAELSEGLWPSPKLMRLMLARWGEEASRQYDLDDEQRAKVRDATVERWRKFLDENREELQPLANEFVEMRMGLEPPAKERVQEWAKRAGPAFERVRTQFNDGADDFRKVLRPLQRAKFEIDAVQMKVGLQLAEQRIKQWQEGEFKPDEFWEPLHSNHEGRHAERGGGNRAREAKGAQSEESRDEDAKGGPADQIAIELDAWDKYAAGFIRRYALDAGQRTTVLSCLSELKQRATAHRDLYREEIAKLEARVISNSGTEGELAEINKQLVELYGPIDDMFKELRSRIEQVPTAEQRAAAEAPAADKDADRTLVDSRAAIGERGKTKAGGSSKDGASQPKNENGSETKAKPDVPPER